MDTTIILNFQTRTITVKRPFATVSGVTYFVRGGYSVFNLIAVSNKLHNTGWNIDPREFNGNVEQIICTKQIRD